MKFKLIVFMCTVAWVSATFGYAWYIRNDTDKNLYIYLGTANPLAAAPIGNKAEGTLIKPGQAIEGSEKLPNAFSILVLSEYPRLLSKDTRYEINKAKNINYSIKKPLKSSKKKYDLVDNNNAADVKRRQDAEEQERGAAKCSRTKRAE